MKQLKVSDEVIAVSTVPPFYNKGDIGKITKVDRADVMGLVFRVKFYNIDMETWVFTHHIKAINSCKSYLWRFFNTGIQS